MTYAEALDFAIAVIESYEMDIRNSEWTGVDLVEVGFCQGRIYKQALPRIKAAMGKALPPAPSPETNPFTVRIRSV